ncbi:hypothetical protein QBC33DRAFT_547574 [Phialemonium atrogriseum]|uniref:Aminoglycoside phosphotransferase domain-containing protein n=1 Tax=Phialemonium atrogriseum TaxID=1093897 RepID=A0AAJ0BY65_9PEZI|nr:uncharacterized protein QBC33DRAFT_547574 [Phialemonium atrogriseum]KAK1764241.1 hypothetical protein QBC33DRAFT_547574 [Phialemonium atrogriseum]
MGTPADALPQPLSEDAIHALLRAKGLPKATSVISPKVTAQYHAIYFITLPASEASRGHSELVLRVSGRHLPSIKTKNEIGIMTWIAKYTTIPIPAWIAYDASEENLIGHEYILLSRVRLLRLAFAGEHADGGRLPARHRRGLPAGPTAGSRTGLEGYGTAESGAFWRLATTEQRAARGIE